MLALSIHNLSKTYPTGTVALQDVSLDIHAGEFFALLGQNGAGKSTIINIISGLVNKTSGDIRVMGVDHTADISTAKSYIGLVPQEFNFSIFEKPIDILVQQAGYYGIPRHIALVRAEKYLKELSLWEKRNVMARTLSGGMKRRLMIARALVHEPQILILDEPTAGVDIEIRRGMWDFLKSLNAAGTTIILTTHYLEEAEMLCSRVGILQAGRIVSMGTMQDILGRLEKESFVLDISRDMTDSEIADMGMYAIANTGNKTIEVCTSPVHTLNILFEKLTGYGIQVLSLRNKNNRLEEYFLQITGK